MAMSVTLAMTSPYAGFGQPVNFVATVANSSGGNVNLNMLQPVVTLLNGQPFFGAVIGPATPSAQTSVAQSGGYQFNIVIPAAGSVAFAFSIQFQMSPFASGTLTQPALNFNVGVNCFSADGSSFSAVAPIVMLQAPIFGPALGAGQPSNQYVGASPAFGTAPAAPEQPGTLSFQVPFNAVLAL